MTVRNLALIFVLSHVVSFALAQDKPLSPLETVNASPGGVETTIVYCRPSARGRVMIGGKEPFGQVWRTGANAATTIEFDKDVLIEGKILPAGKYSLFTIPDPNEWTVIFNKVPVQWGAYNYNQAEDILRVKVKVKKPKAFIETFAISVDQNQVWLSWENYQVSFSVKKR
jgi:hypothetical protein